LQKLYRFSGKGVKIHIFVYMPVFPDDKTQEFILSHEGAEVHLLALKGAQEGVNLPLAIRQIEGKQKARQKLPDWYKEPQIIYPPKISLEQCSSAVTSAYKATLVSGETFADLTGGMGVDTLALSSKFSKGYHVEQQSLLSELAAWNLPLLGAKHIQFINNTAEEFLKESHTHFSIIYADPSRRVEGRKVHGLSDCIPDIPLLLESLKKSCDRLLLKLSPMLDIQQALRDLKHTAEVHIVEYKGECKELLLLLDWKNPMKETTITIADLDHQRIVTLKEPENFTMTYDETTEEYLYEPGAALMKSGRWDAIASLYGLKKIAPNTHVFTSAVLVPDFPGRVFKIKAIMRYERKEVNAWLKDKGASITCRNFPDSPEQVRKRLKISDGQSMTLFAVRNIDNKPVLILGERL
jgi:hypothetical protein